mgnify:FL=1|jgi:hydroxyacyl-ACP dehydratase HTD2-like protein with hotdog domain
MTADILQPLTKLKVITQNITIKSIQNGAISSRDWAPLHSNQTWAINKGNLPNIIMNNYTLNGLIIKYVTDIYGHASRVAKVSFKIMKPICPETSLEFHGHVAQKQKIDTSRSLLCIDLLMQVNEKPTASAKIYLAVNETSNVKDSPWNLNSSEWAACFKLCSN